MAYDKNYRKTRRLKACPFCGEKKRLQMMCHPITSSYRIMCLSCLSEGPAGAYIGEHYINRILSKSVTSAKSWATRHWNNLSPNGKLRTIKRTGLKMAEILAGAKKIERHIY